jgi:hypothetical protein
MTKSFDYTKAPTVAQQIEHATRRPAKRVYLGTYENVGGLWRVYVQVEQVDGRKKKQSKRS